MGRLSGLSGRGELRPLGGSVPPGEEPRTEDKQGHERGTTVCTLQHKGNQPGRCLESGEDVGVGLLTDEVNDATQEKHQACPKSHTSVLIT